jgi:hypothetical protein
MTELRALDQNEVLRAATVALEKATGCNVGLQDAVILSSDERRNLILRVGAVPQHGNPRSIIIKATRAADYDSSKPDIFENSGLAKEWTATAFLAQYAAASQHGAALLGGDARFGLLIFEDLGSTCESLVSPLLEGTPDTAERALTAYAASLGRLHAHTARRVDNHELVLRSIYPKARRKRRPQRAWFEDAGNKIKARLGTCPPLDELYQIADRVEDPGPWRVLVHGDPCPDNALLVAADIRLIDFEFAAPGHALFDGVYWRMGFPTCWCAGRIPEPVLARVEGAYRAQLGTAISAALDDGAYRAEVTLIAAARLFRSFSWLLDDALKGDDEWGISTKRSRLLWYLEATIRMSEESDTLPGFAATMHTWLTDLRARWPETVSLALYPAFSGERVLSSPA